MFIPWVSKQVSAPSPLRGKPALNSDEETGLREILFVDFILLFLTLSKRGKEGPVHPFAARCRLASLGS